MLTKTDVDNIQFLKKKGYSRRRAARELHFNAKTVARYWGESVRSHRFEDYFSWERCRLCGVEYPRPKFVAAWLCPGCRNQESWNGCWYGDPSPSGNRAKES